MPRALKHFTPALVARLAETDAAKARTSKKDDAVRRAEVRAAASEGLLQLVQGPRAEEMVRDPGGSLVVGEIMLNADGGKACSA